MTNEEFIQIAIESSIKYREWLDNEGKGISIVEIDSYEILDYSIKLTLKSKLSFLDDVQVKINNKVYSRDEIQIVKYERNKSKEDERTNRFLYIRPRDELRSLFDNLSPKEIKIISDLKFLIRRVQNWYCKYSGDLAIPSLIPAISSQIPLLSTKPSSEQISAFQGIAASPFSYIWGAPGTGKTQFVLARAVLAYCQAGLPVLITAPTNNAVEQTMKGVLAVLEEAGIPFKKVLRLGIPSAEFYAKYPMVCEARAAEEELQELENRRLFCSKAINFYQTQEWCDNTEHIFNYAWQQTNEAEIIINKMQKIIVDKEQDLKVIKARLAPILSEIDRLNEKRDKLISFIKTPLKRVVAWVHRKKLQQAEIDRIEIEKRLGEAGNEHKSISDEQEQIKKEIHKLKANVVQYQEKIGNSLLVIHNISPSSVPSISSEFISIVGNLAPDLPYMERLKTANQALIKVRKQIEDKRGLYSSITLEQAQQEIESIDIQKEKISPQSSSQRLQDCLVVASTVDGFINKLADAGNFHPNHIFLDEAAYCPLIKAAVLLSLHIPLTLLGDHMQLPPVCEMPDTYFEKQYYKSVCLWAQSALYLETIFSHDLEYIFQQYRKDTLKPVKIQLPKFSKMQQYTLQHTFRFGDKLASVLGRFIYTLEFKGNSNIQTEIIVVNAPHLHKSIDNTSIDECIAIRDYLNNNSAFYNYAVLTPYRNQRALLSKYISRDMIFTIHGSQGREWDTVLISIVSTTAHSFLTPRLINTAVSRAKKQLIIVCDASYWSGYNTHIIGGIIEIAESAKQ